ncbi:MAG: proline dehydrogenase family protein [Chitinophagaceae bacterium]|nr:proline dehydrogenase family protein [Chitinophagaceae bacterium]
MHQDLLKLGSEALKKAALNEEAKNYVLQNKPLFQILKKAANRYIGGETLDEAVQSILALNKTGFQVTTDFMGESIRNEKDANEATEEFLALASAIKKEQLNSSISLDLSHIGLLVSRDLVIQNLHRICEAANASHQEVIISMEGTDRTDQILEIYRESLKSYKNLGITLQAYLHRTKDDFKDMLALDGSIRLVKGAYDTPAGLSMPRGNELDECYLSYAEQLLSKNHPCAIASHDEKIHRTATQFIDRYQPTNYVLERLLGICNEELLEYKNNGYRCRMYVVYGKEWFLYLCNRWAEYPLNLFRGLADIVEA